MGITKWPFVKDAKRFESIDKNIIKGKISEYHINVNYINNLTILGIINQENNL